MPDESLSATIHPSTASIPAAVWNALLPSTAGVPDNPFLEHAFFLALEESGCATRHVPFLHFEICYYQAIDYAITHKLQVVEAGAQGEHKLARGYEPTTTRSIHYIADPGLRRAIADYLVRERAAVTREQETLDQYTPFRKGEIPH